MYPIFSYNRLSHVQTGDNWNTQSCSSREQKIMIYPLNYATTISRSARSSWHRISFQISFLLLVMNFLSLFYYLVMIVHNLRCRLIWIYFFNFSYIQNCISSLRVRAIFIHFYVSLNLFKLLVFLFKLLSQFIRYIFRCFYIIFLFLLLVLDYFFISFWIF